MKYLAILTDSLREALDSKVTLVMLGISGVLILALAQLSFRRVEADKALEKIAEGFRIVHRVGDGGKTLEMRMFWGGFDVKNVEPLDAVPEGYRFVFSAGKEELRKAAAFWSGEDQEEIAPERIEEFIKHQFDAVGDIPVTSVLPIASKDSSLFKAFKPQSLHFQVETGGTRHSRAWPHDPCFAFGAAPMTFLRAPLGTQIHFVQGTLVNGLGAWIAILVGVVITAFFIPNMLRKGSVDLLLVKPISRSMLLLYKYLGGLSFMLINTSVVVGGVWLAIGLRSGVWATGFLFSILILTFFFAILYGVSTLFAVVTRNAIVAILMTCLVWALLFCVGITYQVLEPLERRSNLPGPIFTVVDYAHYLLPRTRDLVELTDQLLSADLRTKSQVWTIETLNRSSFEALSRFSETNPLRIPTFKVERNHPLNWTESLAVSGTFLAVMLGLACLRFATTDY